MFVWRRAKYEVVIRQNIEVYGYGKQESEIVENEIIEDGADEHEADKKS